jgi:hypothetical protein
VGWVEAVAFGLDHLDHSPDPGREIYLDLEQVMGLFLVVKGRDLELVIGRVERTVATLLTCIPSV